MKRVILGLGAVPGKPRGLHCKQVSCDSVELTWQSPEYVGHPPFHKYKLQRAAGADSTAWVSANKYLDDEDVSWVDQGLEVHCAPIML